MSRISVGGTPTTRPGRSQTRGPADRIGGLDFTKGTLVLIMVLYHWLNYFVSPDGFVYRYLRFLTPSFIFITGFLIAQVYFGRYGLASPGVPRRLLERGVKLLGLFVALNAVRGFMIPDARRGVMPTQWWTLNDSISVFLTGNVTVGANGKAAAFLILVPIAYALVLAAALAVISRWYRRATFALCGAALMGIAALALDGQRYGNLELMAIALLGMSAGHIPMSASERVITRRDVLIPAYLSYLVVVTIANVNYPIQVAGVVVNLMAIYALGVSAWADGVCGGRLRLVGRYALFGYIAHIAILQALYRLWRPLAGGVPEVLAALVAAVILTVTAVGVMDLARRRTAAVDRLYRVVFA